MRKRWKLFWFKTLNNSNNIPKSNSNSVEAEEVLQRDKDDSHFNILIGDAFILFLLLPEVIFTDTNERIDMNDEFIHAHHLQGDFRPPFLWVSFPALKGLIFFS